MPRFSALRIERNPFNYKEGPFIIIVCPMSSDPFYIVSYYIKRVTTSWTHSKKTPELIVLKCSKDTLRLVGYNFFSLDKNFTDMDGIQTWPLLNVFLSAGGFGYHYQRLSIIAGYHPHKNCYARSGQVL